MRPSRSPQRHVQKPRLQRQIFEPDDKMPVHAYWRTEKEVLVGFLDALIHGCMRGYVA